MSAGDRVRQAHHNDPLRESERAARRPGGRALLGLTNEEALVLELVRVAEEADGEADDRDEKGRHENR